MARSCVPHISYGRVGLVEQRDDQSISGAKLRMRKRFPSKYSAGSQCDVDRRVCACAGVDGPKQVGILLQCAQGAVPVHQRRMPTPLLSWPSDETARLAAGKQVLVRVWYIWRGRLEAAVDQGFLDLQGLAQHGQLDGVHVVAMDPDLAHYHVGRALPLDLGGRGPDMLGQVAQAGGGGTVGLEDGLVAEENGDGDGQDDGEQPMAGRGRAMGLEGAADGVGGG